MIKRLLFILAWLICGSAIAQTPPGFSTYLGSGQSPLSDPFAIAPYWLSNNNVPVTASGYTPTSCTLVGGETTAVIIVAGQSNATNMANAAYTVTQARNHQLNIFDGKCYASQGIMIGVQSITGPPVSAIPPVLADNLITDAHYQRVIIVPMAVGGTSAAQNADAAGNPYLYNTIAVVARRLAAAGLVATHVLWMQGETDTALGTSQANYTISLNKIIAGYRNAGIAAPFLVQEESWISGAVGTNVQNAQLAATGTNVFVGANLDSITNAGRYDTTHFSGTGARTAAGLLEAQVILH